MTESTTTQNIMDDVLTPEAFESHRARLLELVLDHLEKVALPAAGSRLPAGHSKGQALKFSGGTGSRLPYVEYSIRIYVDGSDIPFCVDLQGCSPTQVRWIVCRSNGVPGMGSSTFSQGPHNTLGEAVALLAERMLIFMEICDEPRPARGGFERDDKPDVTPPPSCCQHSDFADK